MTLYPLSLIYLLLPVSWALGVFCLVHYYLAGLGMYCLASAWTGNRFAGAVAGVAFIFNALMMNFLMWPNNIAAMGWLPWVVLASEQAWRRGGRAVVLAGLVGAMQMLTGAPEVILLTWVLLAALLGLEMIRHRAIRWQAAVRFSAIVLVVAGLAAAQLLPFLDLLGHSHRDAAFKEAGWPMPIWGLANFFVPLFRSFQTSFGTYAQPDQYWVMSYYLGVGIVLLALLGGFQVRQPRVRLLGAITLLCLILAMGEQAYLYTLVRRLLPIFGLMRYPVKFVILPGVLIPLLAAFFVAHCFSLSAAEWPKQRRRLLLMLGAVVAVIAFVVWMAFQYPLENSPWTLTARNGGGRVIILVALVAVFIMGRQAATGRFKALLLISVPLLLWLDALTMGPRPNPTVPKRVYEETLPYAEIGMTNLPSIGDSRSALDGPANATLWSFVSTNAVEWVTYSRLTLYDNCNLLEDVPKVLGLYSLYVREYAEVLPILYVSERPPDRMLDFLGVAYINKPGSTLDWVFRPSHHRWVTSGQRPVFADSESTLQALAAPGFDSLDTVYLPTESQKLVTVSNRCQPKLATKEFSSHQVRIEIEAPEPAMLVVAQAFHHNWRATVDGTPAPLLRANHAFQALQVPAGFHQVTLVYRDRAFVSGVVISLLALGTCGMLWWWQPRRRAQEG